MTDQPQGRDAASPSIAALAVCVDELRREAEGLAAKVKKLASTQRQQAVLLEGLAELRQQIDRILSTLTEQDEDGPTTWFWLTMSEHERDEKLSELADWVETVRLIHAAVS